METSMQKTDRYMLSWKRGEVITDPPTEQPVEPVEPIEGVFLWSTSFIWS